MSETDPGRLSLIGIVNEPDVWETEAQDSMPQAGEKIKLLVQEILFRVYLFEYKIRY
jgi:hypothetical protein